MSHNVLSLQDQRFDLRTQLGGCLLNLNGETFEVAVTKAFEVFTSPTYTAKDKETLKELCTFRPYHMTGGPLTYQLEGVSQSGGDGTLLVPGHDMLSDPVEDDDR